MGGCSDSLLHAHDDAFSHHLRTQDGASMLPGIIGFMWQMIVTACSKDARDRWGKYFTGVELKFADTAVTPGKVSRSTPLD